MIISASKITDIPLFYSEWFMNRIRYGNFFKLNIKKQKYLRYNFSPENVEAIVFWTKNPKPLIKHLKELDELGYNYYFQFTLTPYNNDIEKGIGNKREILATFKELSNLIGAERVIWRYSPIIINNTYDINYHMKAFKQLITQLKGYTKECVINFTKDYNMPNNPHLFVKTPTKEEKQNLAAFFALYGLANGITIKSCMENMELVNFGVKRAGCIEKNKIETLFNQTLVEKHIIQNFNDCLCYNNFDIGENLSCMGNCEYCNNGNNIYKCSQNYKKHNAKSIFISKELNPNYKIKNIILPSFKTQDEQLSLLNFSA